MCGEVRSHFSTKNTKKKRKRGKKHPGGPPKEQKASKAAGGREGPRATRSEGKRQEKKRGREQRNTNTNGHSTDNHTQTRNAESGTTRRTSCGPTGWSGKTGTNQPSIAMRQRSKPLMETPGRRARAEQRHYQRKKTIPASPRRGVPHSWGTNTPARGCLLGPHPEIHQAGINAERGPGRQLRPEGDIQRKKNFLRSAHKRVKSTRTLLWADHDTTTC